MQVHGTICNEVAPALAALAEQLDSSTLAWTTLNGLLSSLASSKALLERAVAPTGAQAFNIGDAVDGLHAAGDKEGDGSGSEWSESDELREWGAGDGGGRDHERRADHDDDQCMGTGDWWDSPQGQWQQPARWAPCGHGKWSKSSWADSWEREYADDADDALQPAAARRRLEPRDDGGEESGAVESTPARDKRGDAADDAKRKQQYEQRVASIVQCAIDAGVQPITQSGEELQMLDLGQLDAWVAEHLPTQAW
jgi:hypothetical protein